MKIRTHQIKLNHWYNLPIIFVVLFAIAGMIVLTRSWAAIANFGSEAEGGTLAGSAVVASSAAASKGSYVKFGSGGSLLRPVSSFSSHKDLSYGQYGSDNLMDVYIPDGNGGPYPTVMYVHGGAWLEGNKDDCMNDDSSPTTSTLNRSLVYRGFAMICINYRLTNGGSTPFPAQIQDVKAAIRYVRANGGQYGLYTAKLGVIGDSAGGHLVAMAGVSGSQSQWDVGQNLSYSSKVQAVADFFGPTDLISFVQEFTDHQPAHSPESDLIGGEPVLDNQTAARAASPVTYVDASAPPFILFHGTSDGTVPANQSRELDSALRGVGVSSSLYLINGAGHEDPSIFQSQQENLTADFFDKILR